ncbi:MAG: HEAT repeat domain-containing protein [Actinomycetota bacterium]|nr:HEAT repeat domain-containing protein [Actinomycetota bacterium]
MDETIVRLGHWEPAVRAGAAALAGTQRITPAILALIRALADPIADVRRAAVVALGEIGATEAVEPLITTLQTDPDGVVRRRAASALGRIGDPRATEPLLSALLDIRAGVTGYAALALDALGASWSAPFAERIRVPDVEQRRWILIALHRFQWHGQRPRGVFAAAAEDSDKHVRLIALMALAQIADPATSAVLRRALADPHPYCREEAAVALGKIGDRGAVAGLIEAAGDAREDTFSAARSAAVEALRHIGDPQAIAPLLELLRGGDGRVRACISHELGGWPAQGLAALASLLADPDSKIRWWGVAGLKGHGAAAFALVEPSLLDPDPEVRSHAVHVLAEIDPEQAVPTLIARLEDQHPNVRWDAAQTLGQLGDARVLPALRRLRATDTEETTAIAYARRISEVAQDAIWDIHRRYNPNLFQIGEIVYERVGGELRPAPNWEQDTW